MVAGALVVSFKAIGNHLSASAYPAFGSLCLQRLITEGAEKHSAAWYGILRVDAMIQVIMTGRHARITGGY